MAKLSVCISAYNEEQKIKDCLESIKWADEIIFVDNSSSDKTIEIAKKYTAKIFIRKNNLTLNINKNFGFTKAANDWILCLDADERVSPELAREIQFIINQVNPKEGYWMRRKNIIFGKWIRHTGWYPDYQLRLFKRDKGRFAGKHVHEMIKIDGETDYLQEHLIHYNYEGINQFLYKHFAIYAPNEIENLLKEGYRFNYLDAIRFPSQEFLSRFFAREGYRDGFHGLMLSIFMAFYYFVIFARIWESQNFKEIEDRDLINNVNKEFKKTNRELTFWFVNEKIKNTNNFFQKNWLKIIKKLF